MYVNFPEPEMKDLKKVFVELTEKRYIWRHVWTVKILQHENIEKKN